MLLRTLIEDISTLWSIYFSIINRKLKNFFLIIIILLLKSKVLFIKYEKWANVNCHYMYGVRGKLIKRKLQLVNFFGVLYKKNTFHGRWHAGCHRSQCHSNSVTVVTGQSSTSVSFLPISTTTRSKASKSSRSELPRLMIAIYKSKTAIS